MELDYPQASTPIKEIKKETPQKDFFSNIDPSIDIFDTNDLMKNSSYRDHGQNTEKNEKKEVILIRK